MITLIQYWMGRDSKYRGEWTEEIQANGAETVERVNKLLALAEADGIVRDVVASGWRPAAVNEATSNSAAFSKHLFAMAGDVGDNAHESACDRALAQWCIINKQKLVLCELWMEDPRWCAKWNEKIQRWDYWCHFQTVPPGSGKRIYIPSMKPPAAPALIGQDDLPFRVRV